MLRVVVFVSFLLHVVLSAGGKRDPSPLFKEGHENITYLTDHNFNELVRDAKDGKPWIIDFYHPYCPHCRQFVPIFTEIAAYYKPMNKVNIGAMSCMDWEQCAIYAVKGFPSLALWNFDPKMNFENKRAVGEHTKDEVLAMVGQLFREQVFNATGVWPSETPAPTTEGVTTLRPLWEESTLPSNPITRVQDAASAFVFAMRESVFLGRTTLEDAELDALKDWLRVVALTFPGEVNRRLLSNLYKQVASISLLTHAKWRVIFQGWQDHTAVLHIEYTKALPNTEEWENLPTAFEGDGTVYYACELYTCGQWTMFHMMTMMVGPGASDELAVGVMTAIRRFVRNFLNCMPCRQHFLAANTLSVVEALDKEPNKKTALYMWLWKMHNGVNKRIRHFQWPKPDICTSCGVEDKWRIEQVEHWLHKTYGFEKFKPKVVTTTSPPKMKAREDSAAMDKERYQTTPGITVAAIDARAANRWKDRVPKPDMGLFAWYLLPVACFVGYFVMKRMRGGSSRSHSHHV